MESANVSNDFIILARTLVSKNNFINALNMYLCAFAQDPRCKISFFHEFRVALTKLNMELAAVKNKTAIFANFAKAIKVFPDNVYLLNDIGCYLYRYEFIPEAMCHFERVLFLDSSYISAEKYLNSAKTFLFPRSYYKLLNDRTRNSAYRAAIRSCVIHVDSVIDIDAGAGLLAFYASECNPVAISACESSTPLAQLAQAVLRDNQAPEIIILNKPSTILECIDVYFRKSVLLTDAFDAGLFGEYILQSLYHAWQYLLDWNSIVIPGKAEYFIAGIECEELYKKYKLSQNIKKILDVADMNVHSTTYFGDTYASEDVHLYDKIKYICEPQKLFTIDLNSYQDIDEMLHRQEPYDVKLTATEDGDVNVIIGWFNLHLTDDIVLTSDPRLSTKTTGYQQAIFFDVLSKKVHQNETMKISFLADGKLTTLQDRNIKISRISPESIAYLNDTELTNTVTRSISAVCIHLGQTVAIEQVDIVDLNPFPLFGVLMMKRGANSLICYAKTVDDELFLKTVLAANKIPTDKVTILLTEHFSFNVFKNKKFHVVFSQFVNLNGKIDIRKHWLFQHLKRSHLISGGLYLPLSVTVLGQLISSDHLELSNRVLDENVNCNMAKHLNRYRVSQVMRIDIARLEYTALSEVFEVASCEDMKSDVVKVSVSKDGDCNAILCWYKVAMFEDWDEIYTNRSNSFIESVAYMTGSEAIQVFRGDDATVLRSVDRVDGLYSLAFEIE